MVGMIREQLLRGVSWEDRKAVAPTAGDVRLVMDDGNVMVAWQEMGLNRNQSCAFVVPARSLLLALRAASDDQRADAARGTRGRERNDEDLDPFAEDDPRELVPWTAEMDEQLRRTWLDERPFTSDIAKRLGRDVRDVASRLERLGLEDINRLHGEESIRRAREKDPDSFVLPGADPAPERDG